MSNLSSNIDTGCMSDGQSSMTGSSLAGLSGHTSGQRTKRMRTSFKHHQLRTMKSYFSINQNPDAKDLKQLAQKTGLSKRVLQVREHRLRPLFWHFNWLFPLNITLDRYYKVRANSPFNLVFKHYFHFHYCS